MPQSLTLFPPGPEPIQSRCAVLRYTKLTDAQILARLLSVIEKEKVQYTDDGLEAVIFTAQGDMRQVRAAAAPVSRTGHAPRLTGRRRRLLHGDEHSQTRGCLPDTLVVGLPRASGERAC